MDADPPHRPEIILWVELPGEIPVAMAISNPDTESPSLVTTLREAFARPMAGPPRRSPRGGTLDVGRIRAELGMDG